MFWIELAILAYFLDAVVFVVDKYLLSESIPHPSAYAFFVALLSGFALLLIPFGVYIPSGFALLVSLVSGLSFFVGLFFLYTTVRHIDVTEAMPAIGGVTALATFAFSYWFLAPEILAGHNLLAFVLLVGGTLMMSYFHLESRVIFYIIAAGVCMAFSFVLMKYVFNLTDFINGLFWTRVGLLLGAGIVLLLPRTRHEIKSIFRHASHGSKLIFILNKILAAAAFIMIYYAIRIGNVVFVNAMQGVQYVFILLIGALLVKAMPMLFERHREKFLSARKWIATSSIVAGLILLFI